MIKHSITVGLVYSVSVTIALAVSVGVIKAGVYVAMLVDKSLAAEGVGVWVVTVVFTFIVGCFLSLFTNYLKDKKSDKICDGSEE